MTSQEFVIWLKGFTEGVHDFNITPKQWDLLKERLAKVEDDITSSPFPFGTPNTTPNTTPMWQEPHYPNPLDKPYRPLIDPYDPFNPFRITCDLTGSGTTYRGEVSIPSIWTSTSGSSATFTVTSGSSYSPSTVTYLYPNGTNVSYTTTGGPTWHSINKIENDSREK